MLLEVQCLYNEMADGRGMNMVAVKTIAIDGETIHIFQSVIYVFESSSASTLELDIIVSEVTLNKYKNEKTLIVEIQLDNGTSISSIMHVKILPGRLPHMSLYMELEDQDDFEGIARVRETDVAFPQVGEGITIEEIRQVEMPNDKITLKLTLPIDQTEWLREQKNKDLNLLFKEFIYTFWKR